MIIKEISLKYQVEPSTLRYYEKIVLLKDIPRQGNIRYYDSVALEKVDMIICMRKSGISIELLQKYFTLMENSEDKSKIHKELLEKQREIVINRMAELNDTLLRLNEKIKQF